MVNLKDKLKNIKCVRSAYNVLMSLIYKILFNINPKLSADYTYYKVFHKHINWNNPQDLIEKIFWLELNTDTSLWSLCSDKYRVREYVKEKGCENILNHLYGHWDNAKDIDFEKLPNSFVLKTNNACATVMIVKDKNGLNNKKTKNILNKWMHIKFGYNSAQLHYLNIEPCIIAEELLIPSKEDEMISPSSLIDYKILCLNGKPECILVVCDRGAETAIMLYNLNWQKMPDKLSHNHSHFHHSSNNIPKPKCLDKMLEIAATLSQPFLEVRVDLYVINEKPVFGELTFSTGFGYYSKEYYEYLGSKIDILNY